ncbi:MAG TPA: succinate dehydrogenase, cytochrome b556 subunit [Symbiobacteriaceae bacterium]
MAQGRRDVRAYPDLNPKYYRTGMWSYLLHRISGVAIVVFLLMHIWEITSVTRGGAEGFNATMAALETKGFVIGEWLLFLAITFHSLNGFRLILHDLKLGVRKQKQWFWTVFALSAVVVLAGSYYFLQKFLAYPWSH